MRSAGKNPIEVTAFLSYLALAGLLAAAIGIGCTSDPGFPAGAPPDPIGNVGGGTGGDETGGCSTADVVAIVFSARCTNGACHDADGPASGLDLASAGVEARLANASAKGCSGKVLVSPGNAAGSYLLDKLQGDVTCGVQMPKGGAPLDAASINCVADWIDGLDGSGSGSGSGSGGGTGTGAGPGTGSGGGGMPPGGW